MEATKNMNAFRISQEEDASSAIQNLQIQIPKMDNSDMNIESAYDFGAAAASNNFDASPRERLSIDSDASQSDELLNASEEIFSWMLLNAKNMPMNGANQPNLVTPLNHFHHGNMDQHQQRVQYPHLRNHHHQPSPPHLHIPKQFDGFDSTKVMPMMQNPAHIHPPSQNEFTINHLEDPLPVTHRLINDTTNQLHGNFLGGLSASMIPTSHSDSSPAVSPSGTPVNSPPVSPSNSPCSSPSGRPRRRRRRKNLTEEERRVRIERRLEKNREAARLCRQKKNQHMHNLEVRVSSLENENVNLRKQLEENGLQKVDPETTREEKQDLTRKIAELIQDGSKEDELHRLIDSYKEKFMENHDRMQSLYYHLNQIEHLLIPTQVTKMGLWTVENTPQDGGQNNNSDENLWNQIMNQLDLSEEQRKKIVDDREKAISIRTELQESVELLRHLKTKVDKSVNLDPQMTNLMQTLTPKQAAKFILMVQTNPTCRYILNSVWKQSM